MTESSRMLREFMKQAEGDVFSTPIGAGWMGPQHQGNFEIHGADEFRPVGDKYRLWGHHLVNKAKGLGSDIAYTLNPQRIYSNVQQNVADNAAWREKEYGKDMARAQNIFGPLFGAALLGGGAYGAYKAFPYAKKGLGLLRGLLFGRGGK